MSEARSDEGKDEASAPPAQLELRIFQPFRLCRCHVAGGDTWALELVASPGVLVPDVLIAEGYDLDGMVRQFWWHTRPLLAVPLWAHQLDRHALERPRLDSALLLPPPAECRLFHAWSSGRIERLSLGLLRREVDAVAGAT